MKILKSIKTETSYLPSTLDELDVTDSFIYLASPYSHVDKKVKEQRYHDINQIMAELTRRGHILFGPITQSATLTKYSHALKGSWEFWKRFDTVVLNKCDALWVVMLEGWTASVGVQAEIKLAKNLKLPIVYLNPQLFEGKNGRT